MDGAFVEGDVPPDDAASNPRRGRWCFGMRLEDLALVGNCQFSALVERTGAVAWCEAHDHRRADDERGNGRRRNASAGREIAKPLERRGVSRDVVLDDCEVHALLLQHLDEPPRFDAVRTARPREELNRGIGRRSQWAEGHDERGNDGGEDKHVHRRSPEERASTTVASGAFLHEAAFSMLAPSLSLRASKPGRSGRARSLQRRPR